MKIAGLNVHTLRHWLRSGAQRHGDWETDWATIFNFPGKLTNCSYALVTKWFAEFISDWNYISQGFPCSDIWHLDVPFVFAQGHADSLGDPNSTKSSLVTKWRGSSYKRINGTGSRCLAYSSRTWPHRSHWISWQWSPLPGGFFRRSWNICQCLRCRHERGFCWRTV